jgi:hypothetical protein
MKTATIALLICFSTVFGNIIEDIQNYFSQPTAVHGTSYMTITLRNTRDYPISFKILKGDLWETENVITNTQNFAVSKDYDITLGPNEEKEFDIEIMCINQEKNAAEHEPVIPTPLQTTNRFQNQQDLWNYMGSLRR